MKQRSILPFLVLFGGVTIVSTASIMIRFAQAEGVPSLSIAAMRLGFAALLLTPLALLRAGPELRSLGRADFFFALGSGAFLAVHFASWISSLEFTSVASSAALVATNPLWVGLASLLVFRERLGWGALVGIGLTLLGTILISLSDSQNSTFPNPLLGNALALVGAMTVSAYLLIGRRLRRRLSVLAYIWLVYTTAAVILIAWAALSGATLFGFSPYVYLLMLGLAIGPQLLGHTAFNWSLNMLSATFVAVAILGEPLGSALLALIFFGERFAALQLLGFVTLLVGILVAAIGERPAAPTENTVFEGAAPVQPTLGERRSAGHEMSELLNSES
jgi:drug/metabolite transporter (DMT)-like permease